MYSSEESNYCVTRQELLAIVKAVRHFRPQCNGHQFIVRTGHASLVWLLENPAPTGQLAWWLETLSEYNFSVKHWKARKHNNADGLSRQMSRMQTVWLNVSIIRRHNQPFSDCSIKQWTNIPFCCYSDKVLGIATVQATQLPIRRRPNHRIACPRGCYHQIHQSGGSPRQTQSRRKS